MRCYDVYIWSSYWINFRGNYAELNSFDRHPWYRGWLSCDLSLTTWTLIAYINSWEYKKYFGIPHISQEGGFSFTYQPTWICLDTSPCESVKWWETLLANLGSFYLPSSHPSTLLGHVPRTAVWSCLFLCWWMLQSVIHEPKQGSSSIAAVAPCCVYESDRQAYLRRISYADLWRR